MLRNLFTQRKTIGLVVLILLVTLGLCLIINAQLAKQYLQQQVTSQTERMEVYRNALAAVLNRYEYLPAVLSQNDQLFELAFAQPEQASRQLALIRGESGADEVYILRPDGMTIAASNWDQAKSFVGNNYGYRPYFIDALQTERGRGSFYGIGATTLKPGYFVSSRYPLTGAVQAVIVVKVALIDVEKSWRAGGESVFVSDRNGVIILSSEQEWYYKTLQPLTASQKQRIDAQKQFAAEPLDLLHIPQPANQHRISISRTDYIHTSDDSTVNGWKIHYLTPYAAVTIQLYGFWSRALILLLAGLALALLVRTLNIRNALRHSQGESSKLRQLNQSLEHEIVERKQVEAALRQTQSDLRRSSKLAAMGQLSASITHELSQPLSAMKTYLASLANQLQLQQSVPTDALSAPDRTASLPLVQVDANNSVDPRQQTLQKLTGLTERMITISQQLRYFARSGGKPTRLLDLKAIVQGALSTTQPAIQQAGIELIIEQPEQAVEVMAGQVRMEQVVVNLIRNALDAMQEDAAVEQNAHQLCIRLQQQQGDAILSVADTGPGLPVDGKDRLFEPFYSTKPSGVGMGLGLAISGNIIAELGGSLDAENRAQGGAKFTVTLPLYVGDVETG